MQKDNEIKDFFFVLTADSLFLCLGNLKQLLKQESILLLIVIVIIVLVFFIFFLIFIIIFIFIIF